MKEKLDILIADDAKLFREYIKTSITQIPLDANFIEVENGTNLFPTYEIYVPEIMIIDSNLPNINILDFCRKTISINPLTSIIVFIIEQRHDIIKQYFKAGVDDVLIKNIDRFVFGSIISKLVSKKISKLKEITEKQRTETIDALTLATVDRADTTTQYLKFLNAHIKKNVDKIEKLKRLGNEFDTGLKNFEQNHTQNTTPQGVPQMSNFSTTDEIIELYSLVEQGVLSHDEFNRIKQNMMNTSYSQNKNLKQNLVLSVMYNHVKILQKLIRTIEYMPSSHEIKNTLSLLENQIEKRTVTALV
jgi:DNA-binding NarL/FixJ family response regulator